MAKETYKVEILESAGTCENQLFKKMANNGDINAQKLADIVGKVVRITGYAVCHITAGEKEFDINYYATDCGIVSSGSNIFKESVEDYFEEDCPFQIIKIKTKKGSTYKLSPVLVDEETGEVQNF